MDRAVTGRRLAADRSRTWLRDESLESLDDLPAPETIAREIVEELSAALAQFEAVAAALEAGAGATSDSRVSPRERLTRVRGLYRSSGSLRPAALCLAQTG